jgi:hypothetical protein
MASFWARLDQDHGTMFTSISNPLFALLGWTECQCCYHFHLHKASNLGHIKLIAYLHSIQCIYA